jgi:polar amino acid transport system permease protein
VQTSFGTPRSDSSGARPWLKKLDTLYYIVVALAALGFCYYLFTFRQTLLLYFPFLLNATVTTVLISVISMVLAVILGGIGAWARLSKYSLIRGIALVYVEVVRGTPTLVQLLLWGFGIGELMSRFFDPRAVAFAILTPLQSNSLVTPSFNFLFYGVLGLGFNYGAYLTEVFRAGIESISKGQTEAALSLGMGQVQTTRRIILPQAIRITIPPFTNNFITLIQDSALLSTIGVAELQQVTSQFAFPLLDSGKKMFVFVLGGLFYLALCYPLSQLARYLERRLGKGY